MSTFNACVVTTDQLTNWVAEANTRERLCYFVGHLGSARGEVNGLDEPTPKSREVDALGALAWDFYEQGLVDLYQQVLHPGLFAYFLVRTA